MNPRADIMAGMGATAGTAVMDTVGTVAMDTASTADTMVNITDQERNNKPDQSTDSSRIPGSACYISYYMERRNQPMGAKFTRRVVAVAIALAMVLTSGLAVFADTDSVTHGLVTLGTAKQNSKKVTVKSTMEVITEAKSVTYCVNNKGGYKKVKNGMIKGLKEGDKLIIKTDQGVKNWRWMKTTRISQKKKGGKVSWNKVKGATGYQLQIKDKNGKFTYKTVGKKVTSYKVKKGCSVRVRPLKKTKSGVVYSGVLSVNIKVK
jgi:hypothetical protein